jgi:hypothetical protein
MCDCETAKPLMMNGADRIDTTGLDPHGRRVYEEALAVEAKKSPKVS